MCTVIIVETLYVSMILYQYGIVSCEQSTRNALFSPCHQFLGLCAKTLGCPLIRYLIDIFHNIISNLKLIPIATSSLNMCGRSLTLVFPNGHAHIKLCSYRRCLFQWKTSRRNCGLPSYLRYPLSSIT